MILIHPAEEEITAEVVNNFIEIHQAELARYMRLKNLFESQAPILSLDKKEPAQAGQSFGSQPCKVYGRNL